MDNLEQQIAYEDGVAWGIALLMAEYYTTRDQRVSETLSKLIRRLEQLQQRKYSVARNSRASDSFYNKHIKTCLESDAGGVSLYRTQ